MRKDRNKLFFSVNSPLSYVNTLWKSYYAKNQRQFIIDTLETKAIPIEKYLANIDIAMYINMKNKYPNKEFVTLELNWEPQNWDRISHVINSDNIEVKFIKTSNSWKEIYQSKYCSYSIIRATIENLKYVEMQYDKKSTIQDETNFQSWIKIISKDMINLFGYLNWPEIIRLFSEKYNLNKGGKITFKRPWKLGEWVKINKSDNCIELIWANSQTIALLELKN